MISIASYGGGTNSTAMLIGMALKGDPAPEAILFADTGGERPQTYAFVNLFSDWLQRQGYPRIITVRTVNAEGEEITLEDDCLTRKALPSIAYGWKSCSDKFKIRPQDKWCNNHPPFKEAWARGEKVTKLIGFDADESGRTYSEDGDMKYTRRYPLIEWGWDRADCVDQIMQCQLPLPGKSACFFCPHNKAWEIKYLEATQPELLKRALALESNANIQHGVDIRGRGRRFSWADLIRQNELFPEHFEQRSDEMPCGCFDG